MSNLTVTDTLVRFVRTQVKGTAKYAAYVVEQGVTRDNMKDHADTLAALAFPGKTVMQVRDADGKRTRTNYGNAHQAVMAGFRYHFDAADKAAAPVEVEVEVPVEAPVEGEDEGTEAPVETIHAASPWDTLGLAFDQAVAAGIDPAAALAFLTERAEARLAA